MALSASQIHCAECNAILRVASSAEVVTCSYCGTNSHVQRRSSPARLPRPPKPGHAPRLARQHRHRRTWTILAVELVVAGIAAAAVNHFVGIGGVIAVVVVVVAVAATTISFRESASWLGEAPIL